VTVEAEVLHIIIMVMVVLSVTLEIVGISLIVDVVQLQDSWLG
jgi:hypothetical protein